MDKRNDYAYFEALLKDEALNIANKYDAPGPAKRRRAIPVKELDLHRKNSEQAKYAVNASLRSARADRTEKLIIHCGKGLHSNGEPVLQGVVKQLLDTRKEYVKSYTMDINGTFEVKLK